MKPLEKIFWEEIAEMVHAEELLLKWIPKMRDGVSDQLKEHFDKYLMDTQSQLNRATGILRSVDLRSREKKSEGMMGLLSRAQQLMQRVGQGAALDAALVSITRRAAAHNAISYENLLGWASFLEDHKITAELEKMVELEKEAGSRFRSMQKKCNQEAAGQLLDSPRSNGRTTKRTNVPAERWGEW